jgi:glutathione synthase/RimK-type ligase-like ATP-grasp enzyme
VIVLCGIPSERPLELVAAALDELGVDYLVLNQRHAGEWRLHVEVRDGNVAGTLAVGRRRLALSEISGAYVRLMDDRELPEVRGRTAHDPARAHCRAVHLALGRWLELTPARVVNRAAPQGSNGSKPYQLQLIAACGLAVPETLVTNEPDAVLELRRRHGRVVYKSISGARSIVRELRDEDIERLDRIRWCPVQFQQHIPGHDVRVHCIGERAFATAVHSSATDYRYADDDVRLEATELPEAVRDACVATTRALRLELSGIDLRIAPDGEAYCLEVNPQPGFSYYEDAAGQPIAAAIAAHLAAAPEAAAARSSCLPGAG